MRILVFIGTRPEAIKMLPLVIELKKHQEFEVITCFSGQHKEIAKGIFDEFEIIPEYTFNGIKNGENLKDMTGKLLDYFDVILDKSQPDLALVHGDTTTAFCGALASFYRRIKVGHIEAGLRTFDKNSPFPEEFNRVAIDALSDLHFAPTDIATQNLRNEGAKSVFTVGNTVIDALRYSLSYDIDPQYSNELKGKKAVLITTHRRENLGDRMRSCMMGIKDILNTRDDLFAILPVHPNPAVRDIVFSVFENIKNIKICDPMPMKEFHHLLARSCAVFSDSGGIQEEAAYLGVPLFIMRDATERPECLSLENVHLVGCDEERIKKEFLSFLDNDQGDVVTRKGSFAFGNGYACEKIARHLLDSICLSNI